MTMYEGKPKGIILEIIESLCSFWREDEELIDLGWRCGVFYSPRRNGLDTVLENFPYVSSEGLLKAKKHLCFKPPHNSI
jgi:hypothetical protein